MTAATVAPTPAPTPAEVLGITTPTALALLDLPGEARRAQAAKAVADRRVELALYVDLYAERYGHRLDLHVVEDADTLLGELLLLTIA